MIDIFVRDPGIAWTRKPQDPSSVHDGDLSDEYGSVFDSILQRLNFRTKCVFHAPLL
jgi:hypothetical protein